MCSLKILIEGKSFERVVPKAVKIHKILYKYTVFRHRCKCPWVSLWSKGYLGHAGVFLSSLKDGSICYIG